MTGRLPDFLIVGAMKAGTTTLAAWLKGHPGVFIPGRKEVHFFDTHWPRGPAWYAEVFALARPDQLVGEATPGYMFHALTAERLAQVVPAARLLVVLRQPTDRAWSHYFHHLSSGVEQRTFRQAIDEELRGDASGLSSVIGYLARGRYAEQLERLHGSHGRQNVLTLLLDDLKQDPVGVYDETCRFLGLPGFRPRVLGENVNPRATVRFRAADTAIRRVRRTRFGRSPALALAQRLNTRVTPVPPMPAELRAELDDYFGPFNEQLESLLGRDLSRWAPTRNLDV